MYGRANFVDHYEVNLHYAKSLDAAGLSLTSLDNRGERVETIEIKTGPSFFVGLQSHSKLFARFLALCLLF